MRIQSAKFITSMAQYGAFPGRGLPQIAVVGRSNVGKSTMINTLCGQKNLAKTSGTPGKTRLINVFLLNDAFHLIDLPGYGYAKVSKQEILRWGDMMQQYFAQADTLRAVIHLTDIRHDPTRDDQDMAQFLRDSSIPFISVVTKADKISRAQRQARLFATGMKLAVQPFDLIAFSSVTGEGRDKLLERLEAALST
ncbi:MAG TPA: YihA family ribosome biogenesis GTP-binding protein [Clostridiales bacterium]|jgi:GTP-binding protein|nr:YihA family ribosome biogenesis GTP-binding protein [Clostridiales bacterium]